jgi:hypothetical protein
MEGNSINDYRQRMDFIIIMETSGAAAHLKKVNNTATGSIFMKMAPNGRREILEMEKEPDTGLPGTKTVLNNAKALLPSINKKGNGNRFIRPEYFWIKVLLKMD